METASIGDDHFMGEMPRPFVLASTSPRRRQLLEEAGLSFSIEVPDVEELGVPGEHPEQLAPRLATEKALAVAERVPPRAVILAADTLVVLGNDVLGKPRDRDEAQAMLLRLSGRVHRVLTGYAVLRPDDDVLETGLEESRVQIRGVSPEEAARYAAGGEPMDKAGGYAAQGEGGRFIASIDGLRSNVIGLPVEVVLPVLARFGVSLA
jgi:septum formation protein